MTMPVERARSLRWGWEFLWELQSATNLSKEQKSEVLAILKHYPNTTEIDHWAAASMDVFAPTLAPEGHDASLNALIPNVSVSFDRGPTSTQERSKALCDASNLFRFELMSANAQNLTQEQRHRLEYVLRHFPAPYEIDHM